MEGFMQYISIFSGLVGFVGLLAGAGFYIKYTATKANLEGKDETIETLTKSRDEFRNEALGSREKIAAFEAETKVLREIATQTPEIVTLTKAVTKLTATVEKGQKQVAQYFAHKEKV